MSADIVVGQTDFASNSSGVTSTNLGNPRGVFVDPKGRLIIADMRNHRVLIWNQVPAVNGKAADLVLGQTDFISGSANRGGTRAANTLNNPRQVWSDGDKLLVADGNNHRVLLWNTFPTSNGQGADVVIGQSDFASAGFSCNALNTRVPDGIWVYQGKLLVSASSTHQRVLVWNSIPATNGVSADVVIGQPNLTTCTASSDPTSTNIGSPRVMATTDDGKLFLVDRDFNRVLVYNSIPTTSGAEADLVIGQSDLTSKTVQTSANGLSAPVGLSIDGSRLYIADDGNDRVVIFNSVPSTNNASADIVLGSTDFATVNSGLSSNQINNAYSVYVTNNQLFLTDATETIGQGNNRVLIFDNLIKNPGLTLNNAPEGRENNQVRLKGTATVDSPYTVKNVEFSVNGGSFSGATATDGGFDETQEEYYFDFTPTSNQPKDSSGNLIDGYTVRVKSTNNNTDVTDRLFYFSPFDLHSPADNATLTTTYPTFEFSVNKQRLNLQDALSKYQVKVRKGGSDSTANWETLIDDISIDFRSVKNERTNKQWETWGHLDTNNGVYETDKLYATYSDESSRVKVYSKTNSMSGTYQWKVVAVDKSGHEQETGSRNLFVNATSTATTNSFPLAVLNISGLGNPYLNSYNLGIVKSTYYTSLSNPIFYGIAWTNSKVTLKLTNQSCKTDCTKTYSTTANAESRYGINVPKGDLTYGEKYTANLSVALEDKYNELPQFTLSIGGLSSPAATSTEVTAKPNTETEDIEISPSPSPAPSPTPTTQEPQTKPEQNKRCVWFICW
ncbi:MAG: hypothetical protein AB1861_03075 [Cyanobacteriota bacterium]